MKNFSEALKGMLQGQIWKFGADTLFKVDDFDLMIMRGKWVTLPAWEFDFYKERDIWSEGEQDGHI